MHCGVDVGGTKVLAVAIDPSDPARPVAVRRRPSAQDGDALIEAIEAAVASLEADCGAALAVVGVGMAGIVDRDGVVRYSPNIAGVLDLDLRRRLRAGLRRPVTVENDANAAVWAESRIGAGRGRRHVALVTLGTGIGTGFLLGGRLIRGWNGFAGESGHMVVEQTGPRHVTGARGPWEYYASGAGLGRLAREAAARGRFGGAVAEAGSVGAVRGEHVHARLAAEDPEARAVLDEYCRYAAVGVANIVHILDPEVVIISGGLVDIGEPLVRGIEKWTNRRLLGGSRRPQVRVVPARLGSQAGAVGAALLAAEAA